MDIETYNQFDAYLTELTPKIAPFCLGMAVVGSHVFFPLESIRDLDVVIFAHSIRIPEILGLLKDHPHGLDFHIVMDPEDPDQYRKVAQWFPQYLNSQVLCGSVPPIPEELLAPETYKGILRRKILGLAPYAPTGASRKSLYHFLACCYYIQNQGKAFTEEQLAHLLDAHNRQVRSEDVQFLQDFLGFDWDEVRPWWRPEDVKAHYANRQEGGSTVSVRTHRPDAETEQQAQEE